jgi:hypothetical protein
MVETDALVGALLDSCSEQVLETMFFTPVLDRAAPEDGFGRERVAVNLVFRGKPSGAFEVDVDPGAARALAAGFLGIEEAEVVDAQVDQVLAEFTNMTCGSALSSLGRVEYFNLDTPETTRYSEYAPHVDGVRRAFLVDHGTLSVCLRVDFDS